jgi:hypothetical protein
MDEVEEEYLDPSVDIGGGEVRRRWRLAAAAVGDGVTARGGEGEVDLFYSSAHPPLPANEERYC